MRKIWWNLFQILSSNTTTEEKKSENFGSPKKTFREFQNSHFVCVFLQQWKAKNHKDYLVEKEKKLFEQQNLFVCFWWYSRVWNVLIRDVSFSNSWNIFDITHIVSSPINILKFVFLLSTYLNLNDLVYIPMSKSNSKFQSSWQTFFFHSSHQQLLVHASVNSFCL